MSSPNRPWTHGPWRVVGRTYDDNGRYIEAESGYGIGEAWDLNDRPENAANAHIIAAAPELYETLDAALDMIETHDLPGRYDDTDRETIAAARAALAKARGEEVAS